jgi:hypothetical protein
MTLQNLLFSPQEMVEIAKSKLGLNISYVGDSVATRVTPLYHLAGADDIIEFITLGCLYEKEQNEDKKDFFLDRLITIISKYSDYSSKNYEKACFIALTLPLLMYSYASQFNLDLNYSTNNKDDERKKCFLPKSEEALLLKQYTENNKCFTFNELVRFDKPAPYLIHNIAVNFNQRLITEFSPNKFQSYKTAHCYLKTMNEDLNVVLTRHGGLGLSDEVILTKPLNLETKAYINEDKPFTTTEAICKLTLVEIKQLLYPNQNIPEHKIDYSVELDASTLQETPSFNWSSTFLIAVFTGVGLSAMALLVLAVLLLPPVGVIALSSTATALTLSGVCGGSGLALSAISAGFFFHKIAQASAGSQSNSHLVGDEVGSLTFH